MTDDEQKHETKDGTAESVGTPSDEFREGLFHLFNAARKFAKTAEPHVARSLDDAERVLGKIGRGGEAAATEVGKEVATLATRVAEKLRAIAERAEGRERTAASPGDGSSDDASHTQR